MELGWTKLPTLMHLAWAAQYDQYLDELQQGMEAEPPALELTVFSEGTQILGDHGVTVEAEMPPAEQLRSFSRLELEFALGCVGTRCVSAAGLWLTGGLRAAGFVEATGWAGACFVSFGHPSLQQALLALTLCWSSASWS
jgi:hypothetical protein